jgi:hypothetical protein
MKTGLEVIWIILSAVMTYQIYVSLFAIGVTSDVLLYVLGFVGVASAVGVACTTAFTVWQILCLIAICYWINSIINSFANIIANKINQKGINEKINK